MKKVDGHASSIHLTRRSFFPVLVRALNGVDEVNDQTIVGHRHVIAAGLLHDGTVDGIDLGGDALLHILIHGSVSTIQAYLVLFENLRGLHFHIGIIRHLGEILHQEINILLDSPDGSFQCRIVDSVE